MCQLFTPLAILRHGLVLSAIMANVASQAQQASHEAPAGLIEITDKAPVFRQFNNVEITGSSIVRKEQTQALPVQIITREDIRRSGLKTVSEVVQSLPMMGNFAESSQLGMIAGGYSNAAIHGMPNGTLVLVDGLRLAPFGRATVTGPERSSVDLSTLPLADVDRIEVLTDGASSLYGTDAIAGVVNIILRKERKGFEITANAIRPQGGNGQGWVSSLGWGQGQLQRDGYSLMVTAELSRRQELPGRDRPYASAGRYEFETGGQRYETYGPYYSIFASPATLRQRATDTTTSRFVNSYYQNGNCVGESLTFEGQQACFRNGYRSLSLYPQEESQRLRARGELALEGGHTVFADWLFGHTASVQSSNWWPATRSAYGLSSGTDAYNQAVAAGLDPANTRLLWMPDLPALRLASLQTNARMVLGAQGQWQDWHYRSHVYLSQSRAELLGDTLGNLNYDTLGLGYDGAWNNDQVLRPLNANNPLTTQLENLRGGLKKASSGTSRFYGVQTGGSRPLGEIDGKDVLLGLGLDWRTETSQFENFNPPELQVEPPAFQARRQVRGIYGELQIPVTAAWDVNLGARTDHYSDVGSTTNAKVHSRWEISPAWSMRGSLGSGFRAPTTAQTQSLTNPFVWSYSNIKLTCNAQQQAIASSLSPSGSCVAGNPYVMGNGNPRLQPEKSTQLTWGMAFVPHRNLRMSVDLWTVRIRDTIQTLSDTAVLSDPQRYAANYALIPAGFANTGAAPGTLALFLPLQNFGASEKTGIDLEAQWRQPGDWGRWSLNGQATYLLRSRSKATPDAGFTSDLGRFDDNSGTVSPRLRLRLMAGLTGEHTAGFLILNHTSGYEDAAVNATNLANGNQETIVRRVSAFTTWDFQLQHTLNRQLELRAGVRNLFNTAAPLSFVATSTQAFGVNPMYSNVWGRTLDLGMTLRF